MCHSTQQCWHKPEHDPPTHSHLDIANTSPFYLTARVNAARRVLHRAGQGAGLPQPHDLGEKKTGMDKKSSLLFQWIFLGIRQILNNTGMHETINVSTARGEVQRGGGQRCDSRHLRSLEATWRSDHQNVGLHWEIQNEDLLLSGLPLIQ